MLLQLMLAMPAIWLLVSALAAPDARSGLGRGALAAFALLAVSAVLAAITGPFPSFSIEMLPLGIGPLLLFLAVGRSISDPERGEATSLAVARTVAGGLAALCALSFVWWLAADVIGRLMHADGPSFTQLLSIRNERPLGHSNYTAGVAVFALGWTGALAAMRSGRERGLWIAGACVSLVTLFSSGSRGGWLALAALAALGVWFRMVRRGANRRRIFVGVLAVGIATIVLAIAHPRTRALFENLENTGRLNSGDVQRLSMAQAAMHMAADRPLFGHGPGATPLVYPRYRAELTGGVETALQLHSTPLQILADTGGVGLAGALLLVVLVALRLRSESRESTLSVAGCASIAFLGYAVYSITDFQLDVPVFSAAVAATTALALRSSPGVRVPGAAVMLTGLLWMGIVAWTQRGPFAERARYSAAIDALEHSDFAGFRSIVIDAEGSTFTSDALKDSAALVLADPPAYGVQAPAEPVTAIALLRASLANNPDQEIAHFNLGWLLLQSNPTGAANHFREAARLVPDKGTVYLGLSSALRAQGRSEASLQALAAELVNDPSFCFSPLWSTDAFAELRSPALIAASEKLDAIAPGNESARFTADFFLWLAGDDEKLDDALKHASATARSIIEPGLSRGGKWRAAFSPNMRYAEAIRRQRTAYPLLMRNTDMPPPLDLQGVIDNPATTYRMARLFPPKGWLTGPQLRRLLAANSNP